MDIISGGSIASNNGKLFEQTCYNILSRYDLDIKKQYKYTTVYGNNGRLDFYIPKYDIAIECKYQSVAGSVIEKLPYTLLQLDNLKVKYPILLYGGAYLLANTNVISWCKSFIKTINIFKLEELETFLGTLINEK
jgi:hypothetical protein